MIAVTAAIFAHWASYANGFSINVQSASGAGTGEAGRASAVIDATIIYGNPAGLVRLERPEIVAGFGAVRASVGLSGGASVTASGIPISGSNKGDSVPNVYVPFSFSSFPVNDRLAFGIGVYVPFGLVNDYEPTFMGRYHGVYSKVAVISVQPTVSFKVNERLSIGFGPTINRIAGRLKNNLDTRALGGGDGLLDVKGTDSGVLGFNVGVLFDPIQNTTLGLTYHSKTRYKLTGRTRVTGLSGATSILNGRYGASLDITLPESIDFSIAQKFSDKVSIYAGATWTRWSRLDALHIYNDIDVPMFSHLKESFNWTDTWAFAIGGSYQLQPNVVLRAGFTYDASPTSSKTRNVRIPVGDRRILALGAGWSPTPDWSFDVAYTYLWEHKASVNQAAHSALVPSYHGEYKNRAHGVAFQITRRF